MGLLHKTKQFLSQNFNIKDLGETSYIIGIKIHRDISQWILKLSQKACIEKVLERSRMLNYAPLVALIIKRDKFNQNQCPQNTLKKMHMSKIPYASAAGSLRYAQVYIRLDMTFAVGMLGRFQSNLGMDHQIAAKKVIK